MSWRMTAGELSSMSRDCAMMAQTIKNHREALQRQRCDNSILPSPLLAEIDKQQQHVYMGLAQLTEYLKTIIEELR